MDRLDVRILRELIQGSSYFYADPHFRKSLRSVGRRIGVDEGTIRNRLRKFQSSGFLQGWRVYINPRMLGGGQIITWFDVTDTADKDDLLESLLLIDGVLVVAISFGTWMGVILRYIDERSLPRQIELVRRLAGVDAITVQRAPFPECPIQLGESDWAIVRALQGHPRKSLDQVSREVGLSTRTLKRKLDGLLSAQAIFAFPQVNAKALAGSALAVLHVSFIPEHEAAVEEGVAKWCGEYVWHVMHMQPFRAGDPQFCDFNLLLPNVAVARDVEKSVRGVRHVLSARIDLFQDVVLVSEVYDSSIGGQRPAASVSRTNALRTRLRS